MAKVIPIGQPANESERRAISFLCDHLPDGWLIFHNFELRQGQEVFEIDIALLAPHAVYLVDVKGTRGNIDVQGSKWYPAGRQPFFSPLAKLRGHAKVLASLIAESNPGLTELRKAHVQATVLLTAEDWAWWNWLLAAILMPLLAGGIGLTIFIGLAVIALMARLLFGPAPPWDPELDAPIIRWVPDDAAPCWNDGNRLVGSMFDETERREL